MLDKLRKVVVFFKWDLGSLPVDQADIDSEDLLLLGVNNDREVEWVRILIVKRGAAVVLKGNVSLYSYKGSEL